MQCMSDPYESDRDELLGVRLAFAAFPNLTAPFFYNELFGLRPVRQCDKFWIAAFYDRLTLQSQYSIN